MHRLVFHPFAPLILFAAVLSAIYSMSVMAREAPPSNFETIASYGWTILLAGSIVADANRRRQLPCFDFGMFLMMFLPISVPWYCFWSRGRRGFLLLVAIVGVWIAPYLIAAIVWRAFFGGMP